MTNEKRYTGTVLNFDRSWGWISYFNPSLNQDARIFVHQSEIDMPGFRTLQEGQTVEFSIGTSLTSGKRCAQNVKVVD